MENSIKNTEVTAETPPSVDGGFFCPKIVITGGPACGKTTVVEHLAEYRPDIRTVPEAATQVLSSGFPLPNENRPWSEEWQRGLQLAIAGHQLGLEAVAATDQRQEPRRGQILDRGILDGAAYLPGGAEEFSEMVNTPLESMLRRYDAVIMLGWLSIRTYETNSNQTRFEEESRARELTNRVKEAWSQHPNFIEVEEQTERAKAVADLIDQLVSRGEE